MRAHLDPDDPRPIWLLDFDDVLNAVCRKPDRSVWPDWTLTHAEAVAEGESELQSFPIWYSPTVIATVADAHASGVQVVWLSTWERWTVNLAPAIPGLPVLPFLPRPVRPHDPWQDRARDGEEDWWKFDVVLDQVPVTRAVLWTDDDLRFQALPARWAQHRAASTLLIAPPVRLGLVPRQVRQIREFLELPSA